MIPTDEQGWKAARLLALAVPAALLGGAYISQYGFGLYPCEMCWWQRYPHMVAIVLGAAAFALRGPAARLLAALSALAVLVSGLIGAYHAGVEYGWWQGITECTANAVAGAADPLKAILNAPIVRCDQVQWEIFGISLAGFNFLISTGAAVLIFVLLGRSRSAGA